MNWFAWRKLLQPKQSPHVLNLNQNITNPDSENKNSCVIHLGRQQALRNITTNSVTRGS